ncbi:hypothetical protein ABZ957_04745 [Streptomyces sp. NPDC046316]|uniref:hypothetical protein n=1 Tax=Streptomyces sp. NPDC046316 TaxID=3154494 RepID=UPI0033EDB62B
MHAAVPATARTPHVAAARAAARAGSPAVAPVRGPRGGAVEAARARALATARSRRGARGTDTRRTNASRPGVHTSGPGAGLDPGRRVGAPGESA